MYFFVYLVGLSMGSCSWLAGGSFWLAPLLICAPAAYAQIETYVCERNRKLSMDQGA